MTKHKAASDNLSAVRAFFTLERVTRPASESLIKAGNMDSVPFSRVSRLSQKQSSDHRSRRFRFASRLLNNTVSNSTSDRHRERLSKVGCQQARRRTGSNNRARYPTCRAGRTLELTELNASHPHIADVQRSFTYLTPCIARISDSMLAGGFVVLQHSLAVAGYLRVHATMRQPRP